MSSPDPTHPQSDNPPTDNGTTNGNNSFPNAGFSASSLGETLRQLFGQYRRVLSQPGASTFVAELPKASWDNILTQLLLMSVIDAGILFLDQLLNIRTFLTQILFIQHFVLPVILGFNLISFFLWTGLTHFVARGFKGVGTYKDHCYGYVLILVPVNIASALLSSIPGVGVQIAALAGIYSFVLQVLMMMGVQRLNWTRATLTLLLSSFILIVLAMLLAMILNPNFA
ncbi:MAG TPA: Yip1 family protein [Ktedonobacteraceae bacterium]|nr:Yip1 family protein [Ktedonobacteraceae bacterium]